LSELVTLKNDEKLTGISTGGLLYGKAKNWSVKIAIPDDNIGKIG